MNSTVENFIRENIKQKLKKCNEGQIHMFRRMYGYKKEALTLDEVVDTMSTDKLDRALTQIENTINK